MTLLYVALGGALGASCRYLVGLSLAFPLGTLTVNIVGSFVMGVLYVLLAGYGADKGYDRFMPFLMTGMLGGFTTFSAFSLDTFRLIENGQNGSAALYLTGSIVGAVGALFLGIMIARGIWA